MVNVKDVLFVLIQFVLFVLFFADFGWIPLDLPDFAGLKYLCYLLGGIGLLIVILGVFSLNESLTPFPTPRRRSSLVSSGIYRYVRHPIYLGILIVLLAFSFYTSSSDQLAITIGLWVVFWYKSEYEEQMLVEKFPEYRAYKSSTGRFFPKLW